MLILLIRKIPVLRLTNPAEVHKFEQQQVRQQLIVSRLKRQLAGFWKNLRSLVVAKSARPPSQNQSAAPSKLIQWEEKITQALSEEISPSRTMADYLKQAEAALLKENYTEAENAYLEVLKMDPHYLPAYQGLGEVYLEQRDFEAAREVYEFLLKRGRAVASSLGLARVASGQGRLAEAREEYLSALQLTSAVQPRIELAQILREMGDFAGALKYAKEARKMEPSNPKILDFYIEVSILNGQPNQAHEGLEALRRANPENQKIAEFARAIRDLEQKQKLPKAKLSKRSTSFGLPTGKR